jgi:hypothetical protein
MSEEMSALLNPGFRSDRPSAARDLGREEPTTKLRLILTTAISGVALALPSVSSGAPPPPTLSGESFHQDNPTITSATCTETESGGTFEASGTATGPYSGTFHETGSYLVISDQSGHVISYDLTMSFTIDSPVGRVTGTKHSTSFGSSCGPIGPNGTFAFNTEPGFFAPTDTYDARILTASGSFTDTGLFQAFLYPSDLGGFAERFQSSLAAPQELLPTSKAQCTNGGWRDFPQFKNQGQCIAFVIHNS